MTKSNNYTRRQYIKNGASAMGAVGLNTFSNGSQKESGEIIVPTGKVVDSGRVVSHEFVGLNKRPKGALPVKDGVPDNLPDNRPISEDDNTDNPEDIDGTKWTAFLYDTLGGCFAEDFQGYWHVPEDPDTYDVANDPVLFFFLAAQVDKTEGPIVQPVLQWNWYDGETGEGNVGGWSIAPWWGPDSDGKYHHGPVIDTSSGNKIFGAMSQGGTNSDWYIEIQDKTNATISNIKTSEIFNCEALFATLELSSYNYGECNKLSGSVDFYDLYYNGSSSSCTKNDTSDLYWSTYDDDTNQECFIEPDFTSYDDLAIYTPN